MLALTRAPWLGAFRFMIATGLVVLPQARTIADDPGKTSKAASGAAAATISGRVTDQAGAPLADVRVSVVAVGDPETRTFNAGTKSKKPVARSDARGDYRLEVPVITKRAVIVIDAFKPGYRSLRGPLMAAGDTRRFEVVPGTHKEADIVLKPALYFAGVVVDEQGNPIPGVTIAASANSTGASGSIERTESRSDGSFELFNYPETPPILRGNAVGKGGVKFFHPDYIDRDIDDLYAIEPKQRDALRVVLVAGYKVTGRVVDDAGKPVANAMVKAIRKDQTHRKATATDASGSFALRGVSGGLIMLTARALEIRQQTYLPIAVKSDTLDLKVRLKPIELPANLKKHVVLGMQLADVTPELRSTYDIFSERGALIVDPGKDSDRLKIGRLAEGCAFFMVGRTRIGSVSEFVSQILAETAGQNADEYSVRVVYNFSTVEFDGSRTAQLRFTKDDLKQLQMISDQLTPDSP
ncbi:MAG: carboxypeptidase-like regulatory domain-containing protein [Isosphaeraceae bacterium]